MDRISIINMFIAERGYKRYLEISCQGDHTFEKIAVEIKVVVDPSSGLSSDEFFAKNGETFDAVLIDGVHHHDQVFREIENSLNVLSEDGVVFLHDCLPPEASYEAISLCGTVWRAVAKFRERADLDVVVAACDYGVGLIRKVVNPLPIQISKSMDEMTFEDFVANRDSWMRPVDPVVCRMLAQRSWKPLTIAVLVIGQNEEQIQEFRTKSPHVESEARMVYVANPARKFGGTAAIANPFLEEATEDVVGVVHADTSFSPGALDVFARTAVDQNCLTGIVGRRAPSPAHHGYVWCIEGGGFVSTLDSCSVFFRRTLGLRFDGVIFNDFHCVVEDLCLQARARNVQSYVPAVQAGHVGGGGDGGWSNQFWNYRAKLVAKYPGVEIHTI